MKCIIFLNVNHIFILILISLIQQQYIFDARCFNTWKSKTYKRSILYTKMVNLYYKRTSFSCFDIYCMFYMYPLDLREVANWKFNCSVFVSNESAASEEYVYKANIIEFCFARLERCNIMHIKKPYLKIAFGRKNGSNIRSLEKNHFPTNLQWLIFRKQEHRPSLFSAFLVRELIYYYLKEKSFIKLVISNRVANIH